MGDYLSRIFGNRQPPPNPPHGGGGGGGEEEPPPPDAEDVHVPPNPPPLGGGGEGERGGQPPHEQDEERNREAPVINAEERYAGPLSDKVKKRCHKFSLQEAKRVVGDVIALEQSFQQVNKVRSATIDQQFEPLLALRSEIHDLLMGFKQRIDTREDATFSICFRRWAKMAGPYATFHLDMNEMKVVIEDAEGDVVEAADKFSLMLEKCREFETSVDVALQLMQAAFTELNKSQHQIQDTEDAIQRAKMQLSLVEEWKEEVTGILIDTVMSERSLEYADTHRQVIQVHGVQ